MNRFFSKFPWLRPLGCGLLVCALVLSICLPLLGMRAAEPDNPILQAEPQEITVLQAGNAPGHSGSGDGLNASGSGANGDTESDLTGEAEQPDPEEADSEAGQSTEPEPAPQEQPAQPDYSDLDIGTNADSNSGSEGEEPGDTGETDESLPLPDLDLGATLTWYKYGAQPAAIACTPGETVGKRILLSQLNNGMLPYDLRLTGLNAPDARITGAFFAAGNGVPSPIDPSGSVVMTLPDGAEFQNYVFLLQAHVTQKTANGEPVETDVEFTFLLRLESGLDLDLRLTWQTTSSPAEATCGANNTTTRTVKSDTLTDGLFQYSFDFLGESARTADGMDGTVCGCAFIAMLGLMTAMTLLGWFPLGVLPAALAGALMAFLLWNFYPAKLRPGAVGCQFLAGALGCVPLSVGWPGLTLPLALPYWLEGGMVALQIIVWKASGGRRQLFGTAPLHRWLEKRGFDPVNIFYIFGVLAMLGLALTLQAARAS